MLLKKVSLLLCAACLLFAQAVCHAAQVTDIRWGVNENNTLRLVLDLTDPADYHVDLTDASVRIIVNAGLSAANGGRREIASALADSVEMAAAGDKTVVYLPLKARLAPGDCKSFTLDKDPEEGKPERIVLDLATPKGISPVPPPPAATAAKAPVLSFSAPPTQSEPRPTPKPQGIGPKHKDGIAYGAQMPGNENKVIKDKSGAKERRHTKPKKDNGSHEGAPPKGVAGDLMSLREENEALRIKLAQAEDRIGSIEASLAQLKFGPQPQKGAPAAQSGKLAADMQQLQKENATLKGKMAAAENSITALQNKLSQSAVVGDVSRSVAVDVQTLKDENTSLKKRLTEAESKIYELQNNIARLTNVVVKLAQKFVRQ